MKIILTAALFLFLLPLAAQQKEVLVFHKTEGFYHESIPAGIRAIEDLGEKNGFIVKETTDDKIFTKENLQKYNLVIFLNTTGDILNEPQQRAFEEYIENGGNFFGLHSAADTEYEWEWYGKLVGAYFLDHPKIQQAKITVEQPEHPMVSHLPSVWLRKDEWYNYKDINPKINVLLKLDEESYHGGKNGKNHPIAWYQILKNGNVSLYTGLGHTIESYVEPAFVDHLLQGILFALNRGKSSIKQ